MSLPPDMHRAVCSPWSSSDTSGASAEPEASIRGHLWLCICVTFLHSAERDQPGRQASHRSLALARPTHNKYPDAALHDNERIPASRRTVCFSLSLSQCCFGIRVMLNRCWLGAGSPFGRKGTCWPICRSLSFHHTLLPIVKIASCFFTVGWENIYVTYVYFIYFRGFLMFLYLITILKKKEPNFSVSLVDSWNSQP